MRGCMVFCAAFICRFHRRKSNNGRRASTGTLLLFTAGRFPVQQPHTVELTFDFDLKNKTSETRDPTTGPTSHADHAHLIQRQ